MWGDAWGNGVRGELGLPCATPAGWEEPLVAQGALPGVPAPGHFGEGTGGDIEDEQLELLQPARDDPCGAATGLGHQKTKA